MKSAMRHTIFREIKQSFGRFIAILAIIALGTGFFAGLKVTTPAMIETADIYLKENKFMDMRLVSTMGFTGEDITALSQMDGVETAVPSYSMDIMTQDGEESRVFTIHSISDQVNLPVLMDGRMPQNTDECLLDARVLLQSSLKIGDIITVSDENKEETLEMLAVRQFTIVGTIHSPMYINFQRGNTSLGNGNINGFLYVPGDAFSSDVYPEILLRFTGTDGMEIFSDQYEDYIDKITDTLEPFADQREEIRYESVVSDAKKELEDAQSKLDEESAKADKELADAAEQIEQGKTDIADGQAEIERNQRQLDDGNRQLKDALIQAEKNEKQLQDGQAALDEAKASAGEQFNQSRQQIEELKAKASGLESAGQTEQAAVLQAQAKQAEEQLAAAVAAADQEFAAKQAQIDDGLLQIKQAKEQLAEKQAELKTGQQELDEAKQKLTQSQSELADAEGEYEEQKTEAQQKFGDAQKEIDDGYEKLSTLEKPEWYLLDRTANIGYASFQNDSSIVDAISKLFPVFFFCVAALVCLTTMTRMVEEQRTQIGVLKALGYGKGTIAAKYLLYSGLACVLGCAVGISVGFFAFPYAIWQSYRIMYALPDIGYLFDWGLALVSFLTAVVCSVGATLFACFKELVSMPADLIRPKAPKAGKRVFLERITPVWKRMSFIQKVAARNLFRYKKRFYMMILGIGGCTALLFAGFGLRDSIMHIIDDQYGHIHLYDAVISLANASDSSAGTELNTRAADMLENAQYVHQETVDVLYGDKTVSSYLLVPENSGDANSIFHLTSSGTGMQVELSDSGKAVLTYKTAKRLGVSEGDTVTIRTLDFEEAVVTVDAVVKNYIYNYLYLPAGEYAQFFSRQPEYNMVYTNFADGKDTHETAAALLNTDNVANVQLAEDMQNLFGDSIKSLNIIVLLIIFCAGALALVVLYNLTNINITEREREIATLKVLGFYNGETASYVYRENIVLTAIGAVIGLVGGYFLHHFVIHSITIDVVSFEENAKLLSYILAFVLTFIFAALVNFFMYFKLRKIDMAQSMKSIE